MSGTDKLASRFPVGAGAFAVVVGWAVLAGWAFDVAVLKGVFPGFATMKPNSAMAFFLLGSGLAVREMTVLPWGRRLAQICAGLAMGIGLATLGEYGFGWELHLDQALFREPAGSPHTYHPGRMSAAAALMFLLTGGALFLLEVKSRLAIRMADALAYTAAGLALVALAGYFYHVPSLYSVAFFSSMALHTAGVFAVLSAGILCARPARGLFALLLADDVAGAMARRLMPAAVFFPVLFGWLRLLGQREGLYDTGVGVALLVSSNAAALTAIICWSAGALRRADSGRRESEERYRGLFNTLIEGFCIIEVVFDADGRAVDYRFLEVNPAFEKQTGLHDARGRLMRELAPDHEPHWFEIYGRIALTGEPARFVNEAKALNRWYEVSAFRFGGAESRKVAILFNDITEPKRAEAALRESEQRARDLIEALPAAVYTTDAAGRITFFNRAAVELWGTAPKLDSDLWCGSWRLYSPNGAPMPHVESPMARALQTGLPVRGEEAIAERPDGTRISFIPYPTPLRDASGVMTGAVNMLMDITERKRAEETRQELAAIVESAGDAIIGKNLEGIIRSWNPSAETLFGYRAEEIIGQPVTRLIPPDRIEEEAQILERIRRGERVTDFETVRRRKDGSLLDVSLSVSPVHDGSGTIAGASKIVRDITERKRAEVATAQRALQRAVVADLSQHALAGRDLNRLMNDAVALIAQVLGVEFAHVLEVTEAGDELLLRAGVGWREGSVGIKTVPAARESLAGYTLLSSAPVVVEDLAGETRFRAPALLTAHGVVSGMSVIIAGRARPYGVLGAHTTSRRGFSGDDLHFLQSIADLLATAIERRQLEEELLAATGREQRRIGQDLHDGLCQHLAGIEFRNEALARDLAGNPPAREEVEKIGALIRDGTRQARMLARGLAPVELERNGLMSALTELAANSAHLYRIACHFTCEQPVLVTDEATATHLYRIAQEAISNAVRHARARAIAVALRPAGDQAVLTIVNDGTPLPAEPGREAGMGLRIMRYRAEMIGATLRLGSTADGRTELKCTFKPNR
ncbi:MAG: hypothetical protein QOE70_2364 [Chthoniobacter sp.]|jgi:PAS domain S-box-containing protein|nr:hypothetical protein [Chthoniobacter sp.]